MSEYLSQTYDDLWIHQLIHDASNVLDVGSGPVGAEWWQWKLPYVPMTAIDLYFITKNLPPNTEFIKGDILEYCLKSRKTAVFDLIVADHILEHVANPEIVVQGFNQLLKSGGLVHIGIPDSSMFTDKFYRLLHNYGGGHISKITRTTLMDMMNKAGFECLAIRPWPEDWIWLQKCFDLKSQTRTQSNLEEVEYIADVFRRELTLEKGYFYGWEAVFKKQKEVALSISSQLIRRNILSNAKRIIRDLWK